MKPIAIFLIFLTYNCFAQTHNLSSGLVAYYTFDDNKDDASGNGNNGFGRESNTFTYDRFLIDKSACKFNGKNFISVKNSDSFNRIESEDALSVSFWLKTDKIQPNVLPILSKYQAANNEKWSLQINANGNVEFTSLNNKTIELKCVLKESISKQWHHFVFTYSNVNQQAKLYIDGELSEEKKFSEKIGSTDGNLNIGMPSNPNGQIWENRLMDDLRIYSRAITNSEISKLFKITADITLPEIIITYPDFSTKSKAIVTEDTIKLKGSVVDESQVSLTFNGKTVKLSSKNTFEIPVPLKLGVAELFFVATDSKQNQRKVKLTTEKIVKNSFVPIQDKSKIDSSKIIRGPDIVMDITNAGKLPASTFHALIIGNNNYKNPPFEKLNEPINDAQKLYDVLTKQYTFDTTNVTFLKDATKEKINAEFDRLDTLIKHTDNLLIFFAGHGKWDSENQIGYWIPIEAKDKQRSSYISIGDVKEHIKTIKSKHTLVIADACFSGSLLRGDSPINNLSRAVNKLYDDQSRTAMTSGALIQVSDKSNFMFYLLKSLKENSETYLPAEKLFHSFKELVTFKNNNDVVPKYGIIMDTNDNFGDFIFIKRQLILRKSIDNF